MPTDSREPGTTDSVRRKWKKLHRILPVLAILSGLATSVEADVEIRRGGTRFAALADDGVVRMGGRSVGRIEADGTVRRGGVAVGRVEPNGTIREKGSAVAEIETDGTIRRGGRVVGKIEANGTIQKGGRSWGSASNCCGEFGGKKNLAALLLFFSGDF